MKKELIKTDIKAYQNALAKFEQYEVDKTEVHKFLNEYVGIETNDLDLTSIKTIEAIKQRFAKKHEANNTLNLKPLKLMQLMDIHYPTIVEKLDKIRLAPIQDKPKKENYSVFAETPEQIERLNIAKDFLAVCNKLETKVFFTNAFNAPIRYNPASNQTEYNQYWIKQRNR